MAIGPKIATDEERLASLLDRLAAVGKERASIVAKIDALRAAAETHDTPRCADPEAPDAAEPRVDNHSPPYARIALFPKPLPRSRRRLPASLGEFEVRSQRLFARLRQ